MKISPKKAIAGVVAGVLLAVLGGCTSSNANSKAAKAASDAQYNSQALSITGYTQMSASRPYPASTLTFSTELNNLAERLGRYNNPSKISYIYLISQTGAVLAYYTVKGKVSSNGSQMTADQDVIDGCPQSSGKDESGVCPVVVDAPEDDGSYGPAEPGIFFFTTDNVMVTWDGQYLLSDAPQKIDKASVTVTYVDGSAPSSTAGITK